MYREARRVQYPRVRFDLCVIVSFVFFAVSFGGAAWAQPVNDDLLVRASAERRVGYPQRALALLNTLEKMTPAETEIAHVIRLAALVDLERFDEARRLIDTVQSRTLQMAIDQIAVRLAIGEKRPSSAKISLNTLLAHKALNESDRQVAEYELAQVLIGGAPKEQRHATHILERLSNDAKDRSMVAGALAMRAKLGDISARKRLLIEYPATSAAREIAKKTPLALNSAELNQRVTQLFAMRAYDLAEPIISRSFEAIHLS